MQGKAAEDRVTELKDKLYEVGRRERERDGELQRVNGGWVARRGA